MKKNYKEITEEIINYSKEIYKNIPDTMQKFTELSKNAMSEGSINKKTKEFIALAIGISKQCDGCIGFHVKELIKLGTTREEIIELMGICVYMNGGPGLMYASNALMAFDQFLTKEEKK